MYQEVLQYVEYPGGPVEEVILDVEPTACFEDDTFDRRDYEGDTFGYGLDDMPEGVDVSGIDPAELPF